MNFRFHFATLMILLFGVATAFAQFGGFDIGDIVKGGQGAAKVAKGAAGIGLKEERAMGGSLAVEIAAKQGGILKDEALTKRVATIGQALTLYCTRPDLKFTFAVLDNPGVNAFSAPGGYVFVTKGLVAMCKNDNELAGVLAHEIAHITRRHALKLISRNETFKGLGEMGSAAGGNYTGYDDLLAGTLTTILEKGFDPATEFDADQHGTLLMYDTGFPPKTLRDFLAKLKAGEGDDRPFSTHPPTGHRIERLDEYIKENGLVKTATEKKSSD